MKHLYCVLIQIIEWLLPVSALFSKKMTLFVKGRKDITFRLKNSFSEKDSVIWFHAASLGEFEQGLPVIEELKKKFSTHKILLTFFSPSGFEVKKNNTIADVTLYLPLDTQKNAKQFIDAIPLELVFFIKYEYWPNILNELSKKEIKTYLISGIFRENQLFFKWYGGFYRKALSCFAHFFVQNENSKLLLNRLGFNNVTVSGDTRFDRVSAILERNNYIDFIDKFKNNTLTLVAGSTWQKDEDILVSYINNTSEKIKIILAPHSIKKENIALLKNGITKKTLLYSEKDAIPFENIKDYEVFILDTIGILTKVYSFADIAYVGGGFGNPGVHNVLEPAVFGIPIIIGPNYTHFTEATTLVSLKGCEVIKNNDDFKERMTLFIKNENSRRTKGEICKKFVLENKGATDKILHHLNKELNNDFY